MTTTPQLLPYLERLLDGETVEWKTLGEVAEIGTGSSNRQDEEENGLYPFYVRSKNILRSSTYQFDETAIIIPGEGGIGDIFHYAEGKYALHQRAYRIKVNAENELFPKFLFYYMTNTFKPFILSRCIGATATSIRKPMLVDFSIPIPPLRVQARIVEILDKFTQLEAELEARNKQYDFYRNRLLDFAHRDDFAGQVEWKTLGEVAELVRGNGLSKKDFSEFGVPAIHYGQIYTYYGTETQETLSFVSPETAKRLKKVYPGNIVITNTSENIEDVCKSVLYSGSIEAVTGGHATIIRTKDCILPKYLVYYTLTLDFFTQKKRLAKGAKVIDVSAKDLAKIIIPLPPLSEQRRIVEILDRFDTLTNSISEGLPREIALRRKQYEYYRDALLRFPQPAPTA